MDERRGNGRGRTAKVPTYSILKTFTASAMLRLQEAGRVEFDAPVRRYLPEAPVAAAATLADLLRHTSGLADYGPLPAYHEAVRRSPGEPWSDAAFLAAVPDLLFAPGQGWSYSNVGYLLLRRLLEQLEGPTFGDVLRRLIVEPLGLRDTFVAERIDDWATCVPGFGPEVDAAGQPVDIRRAITRAGARRARVSTPADITRVYDALFAGELISAASLDAMLAMVPVPGSHPPVVTPTYGLGIHGDAGSPLGRNYGHGGGGPGYLLSATIYPDTPLGRVAIAVGVTSSRGPDADDCERHLMRAMLGAGDTVDGPSVSPVPEGTR